MHRLLIALTIITPIYASSAERRCGWLENPTPANFWLVDADSSWTISTQGTPIRSEDSIQNMPQIDEEEFVRTNGEYGFSCVCLDIETDKETSEIVEIYGGKQLLLKNCLEDSKIKNKIPIH